MKQYCRYCANCYIQDDDLVYCAPKDEMRSKQQCSRVNKCKRFEFNELDVFDIEKKYKPRKVYPKTEESNIIYPQISFAEIESV